MDTGETNPLQLIYGTLVFLPNRLLTQLLKIMYRELKADKSIEETQLQ